MTRVEVKGEPYNLTEDENGWVLTRMVKREDRFYRCYHIWKGTNGAPTGCTCPDQSYRGGVCKHMSAVLELYLGSVDTPVTSLEGER